MLNESTEKTERVISRLDSVLRFSNLFPGPQEHFIEQVKRVCPGWRYPIYRGAFQRNEFLAKRKGLILKAAEKLLEGTILSSFQAAFVEWRYYSILSPTFHGIVGFAVLNPERIFPSVAEGGLLTIVSGTVRSEMAQGEGASQAEEPEAFCWMKLFPLSAVSFLGVNQEHVHISMDGVDVRLRHEGYSKANISISGSNCPIVELDHVGQPGFAMDPSFGDDLRRTPGAHWIVSNASPLAHVQGSITLTNQLMQGLPERSSDNWPSWTSAALKKAVSGSGCELLIDGSGYYEHAFGVNPMPLLGWDFCFAPSLKDNCTAVLQTYPHSQQLRYVDVVWRDAKKVNKIRFESNELNIKWERKIHHPDMHVDVPLVRKVTCQNAKGFVLQLDNTVETQLPFLRPDKYLLRHFYISEEVGRTTWELKDPEGNKVAGVSGVLSGGETASWR